MNKRLFSKLIRKEKVAYDATVEKFRRLNESHNLDSDDVPSTSTEVVISTGSISNAPSDSAETAASYLAVEEECSSDDDDDRFLFEDEEMVEGIDEPNITENIRTALKGWAIRQNTSQNSLTDLLHTLDDAGLKGLPSDARTILGTSREPVYTRSFPEGELLYMGIQYNFSFPEYNFLENLERVSVDVGIDGLKLFKSSNRALWPILGHIVEFPNSRPFVIACYSGMSKPSDVNSFLMEFCAEVNNLRHRGVKVGSGQVVKPFNIRLFTCDAPARAFITGVKSHTGKNGCPKCAQVGQYMQRRVCFSIDVGTLRTDISFKNRVDLAHHLDGFKQNEILLESVNIGMVSQFPLDPMHLVDLGVTKKLLQLLVKRGNVTRMNEKLMFLNNYVPSEFPRRSRNLDEISNWKSTEYRQFLLYSGLFVLKDCIPDNLYYHFLLLHSSIRLLSCEKSCKVESKVANEMLKEFVKLFSDLYGSHLISFNVHGLLHLSDCVEQFGPLDNFSAYKFENHMQYIKKIINNPSKILQQLFLRIEERRNSTELSKVSNFGKLIIDSTKDRDSFFFSKKTGAIKIINQQNNGNRFDVVALTKVGEVFREPVVSSSGLGILVVQIIDEDIQYVSREDLDYKYFSIPVGMSIMDFPFLMDDEESESSQPNVSTRFQVTEPFSNRTATQSVIPCESGEMIQQTILNGINRIEVKLEDIQKRICVIEKALADKMPDRAEMQTQGQILRECKVLSAKTQRSLGRITGDVMNEEQTLLQSLLPMPSEETVLKVEDHISNKAYADAMTSIIFRLKGTQGSIEKVMQSLFTDELAWQYNYSGGSGKRAFSKLKIVDMVLAAFSSMHGEKILAVKHYVVLSHNRFKHVRRNLKQLPTLPTLQTKNSR